MNNKTIGTWLRLERSKRNMSQEEVCEKLQMAIRTLSNIENNKGNPRKSTINKLMNFYELQAPLEE